MRIANVDRLHTPTDTRHPLLGRLRPEITTLEAFDAINWLRVPGNLRVVEIVAGRAFDRDNRETFRGPRQYYRTARGNAIDAVVGVLLTADYAQLSITDDEPARAVLGAIKVVRMARWQEPKGGRWTLYGARPGLRSPSYAGGDSPAAVAAAIDSARARYPSAVQRDIARGNARQAIVGCPTEEPAVDEDRTGIVCVDGGTHYAQRRRMVAETVPHGFRDTGRETDVAAGVFRFVVGSKRLYRMVDIKAHYPTVYPCSVVIDAPDIG